jgi:hypothetical protein
LGYPSTFNPPFQGEEKYSALGEAVSGACPRHLSDQPTYDAGTQTIRRDGTSTATPIAVGIAALFIDYAWQFMDGNAAWTYENIRKLFIHMSKATFGKDYRNLVPWSLFGAGREPRTDIKNMLVMPLGMKLPREAKQYTNDFQSKISVGLMRVPWVQIQVKSVDIVLCNRLLTPM